MSESVRSLCLWSQKVERQHKKLNEKNTSKCFSFNLFQPKSKVETVSFDFQLFCLHWNSTFDFSFQPEVESEVERQLPQCKLGIRTLAFSIGEFWYVNVHSTNKNPWEGYRQKNNVQRGEGCYQNEQWRTTGREYKIGKFDSTYYLNDPYHKRRRQLVKKKKTSNTNDLL